MPKGSGGGGSGGRSGGGGGGGGASTGPDMVTPPGQMSDAQLVSSIKALDTEYTKTITSLNEARASGDKERRNMMRQLSMKLETRQDNLLREAVTNRKSLRNQLKYENGRAVGIK